MNIENTLHEILTSYNKAREKHAPMYNQHEGYAILLEEVDELWDEVKKWQPPRLDMTEHERDVYYAQRARMRKEALHVAAMALAFIVEVCDK